MSPDDPLLDLLVCPLDKGALRLVGPEGGAPGTALYNPRLRRLYPVVDGVPQLLPASGAAVTDAEHERFMSGAPVDG